ncbi:MAG: hypothetical protein KIS72_09435, partial [Luteimonas sp.]|nr:hypothetical protein [Luteimonas sp.]
MEKSGWMRRIATCPVVMGLAALSAGAPALAGDDPVDWSDSLSRNRPWDAWLTLERAGDNAQIAAQVGAFLGDERPACMLRPPSLPPQAAELEYVEALGAIVAAAKDARVVMLNESHVRRAHRVFLGRLIEALQPLGFDALAAETFSPEAAETLRDGVPKAATGFYTADPAFADAVRRAHAMGWDFVSYESADASGRDQREQDQADALAAWIEAHPGRRLLVYAGGSHVSEDPDAGWMAARFAARTGIDPLTIAQGPTACTNRGDDWGFDSDVPMVAMRAGAPVAANHVDMVVFHPPAAVMAAESSRGHEVAICVAPETGSTLLRAFAKGEGDDAIPRDQRVVPAGEREGRLRLPPGRYRVVREHRGGVGDLGRVDI